MMHFYFLKRKKNASWLLDKIKYELLNQQKDMLHAAVSIFFPLSLFLKKKSFYVYRFSVLRYF